MCITNMMLLKIKNTAALLSVSTVNARAKINIRKVTAIKHFLHKDC